MSKLDELIKELCPNGVEYKKLGEVCNFQNGFAFKSALFKENGEAILRITNISNGVINEEDLKYFLFDALLFTRDVIAFYKVKEFARIKMRITNYVAKKRRAEMFQR